MENKKKETLKNNQYHQFISIFISSIIFCYFIYGFYTNENSAGAGGYDGDFKLIWSNLLLFKESIILNLNNPIYNDSRTPLIYILHVLVNPFSNDQESFRNSVFIISFLIPLLLFFCIKEKFPNLNNSLVLLLTSIIMLSPYFRTSAYWGLGENYGLFFLLGSYLFFMKLKKDYTYNSDARNIILVFLICIFSSLTIYFDQKLIFIPALIFFSILSIDFNFKIKLSALIFFIIFSIPYIYLIYLWGSIIPSSAASARGVGKELYLVNLGYCLTIIGFYIAPLLLFKDFNTFELKRKFNIKKILFFLFLFIIYFLVTFYLNDFETLGNDGKGVFHKLFLIVFDGSRLRLTFTIISFLAGIILINIFFEDKRDLLIVSFFLILSILTFPFYQEYLDPLILILVFTFFKIKLNISYKNTYFIVIYFLIFLLCTKNYYNLIV